MVAAIHQPQYLPWLPYCDKAASCDVFVYLDNVQFQRRGVQNRNQIKTDKGPLWLTVPVHADRTHTIREVRIADHPWRNEHIRSIELNYARAPYIGLFRSGLRPILEREWEYLVDVNIAVTEWLFAQLGIGCRLVRASELEVAGKKGDLIISICKAVGASGYLSGPGARTYQDPDEFKRQGIELTYQAYRSPSYPQCHQAAGFAADLSALDLVLNTGPGARDVMVAGKEIAV